MSVQSKYRGAANRSIFQKRACGISFNLLIFQKRYSRKEPVTIPEKIFQKRACPYIPEKSLWHIIQSPIMKIFGGSTWYFHGLFCGLCRALFHRQRWKRALHILQQSPRLSTQFPVLRNSGWKYIYFRKRNKRALHNPQKSPWLCTEFPAMIIIVGRTEYSWKVLCVFRKKARYIFRKRALRIPPKSPLHIPQKSPSYSAKNSLTGQCI